MLAHFAIQLKFSILCWRSTKKDLIKSVLQYVLGYYGVDKMISVVILQKHTFSSEINANSCE